MTQKLSDIAPGKCAAVCGIVAEEIRRRTEQHHMVVMDKIATRLKSVPEGAGTMFDNTMILYFPNSGETHHSHGTEYPFIVLSGSNCKLTLGNRYLRLPYWGNEGHKTLGNFYTSILNAHGHPIKHFGDVDPALKIDQLGPIAKFMS